MKTIQIKKVLIALDYDPTAQKVAETGFSIANVLEAEVILLHVVSNPVYYSSLEYSAIMGFDGYTYANPIQLDSKEGIKKASLLYLESTKKHLGDNKIKIVVNEGDFATSILETAKKEHADIIVMGSHSKKWLEDILMGSVAEEVLRKTKIPLLIIPTKKK